MDNRKSTAPTVRSDVATVYVAIELSMKNWLAALQSPRQERASRHKLAPADARGLWAAIERERAALLRCGHTEVRVVTCYEAGRARSTAIELAWLWLRHQPDSALSRWFHGRLDAHKSRRLKRILIVALARKLVVALWRYLTTGLLPEGARFKAA